MSSVQKSLIRTNEKGLWCEKGGFYIDPWAPVETALITHGHADHARGGSKTYYCSPGTAAIIGHRLRNDPAAGDRTTIPIEFGRRLTLGEVEVSFHPAGHILGSAQIRVNDGHETWVVTGDYKRSLDPSCEPFEVVACDTLITESTFGLPIYRWQSGAQIAREIVEWVLGFQGSSVLFCYSLGKAQRILAELLPYAHQIGTIYLHGSAEELTAIYRAQGYQLAPTMSAMDLDKKKLNLPHLVLAPPSTHRSLWMKRFKKIQTGFASGWMRVRGNRRRRNVEKGFVLSDHADWDELLQTVVDSKARRVLVTHGQSDVFARYLRESLQLDAQPLRTEYEGESESGGESE